MSPKPTLDLDAIKALIQDALGDAPSSIAQLVEGMESQAFRFSARGAEFVVRINPSIRGFAKDQWAARHVRVPVPRVVAIGELDSEHAYCISEWAPGETLETLPIAQVERLAARVTDIWQLIAATDMSSVRGFGNFDPDGMAPARSWREVLEETADVACRELNRPESGSLPDPRPAIETYVQLVPRCPNERALIHGDFGANNVLATNGRISAVLDWDLAMVGDPLYDVANVYFWASYLPCMQVQASYFERALSHLDSYRDRVRCYALRIGLEEARENVRDGDLQMARWALARCHRLLVHT